MEEFLPKEKSLILSIGLASEQTDMFNTDPEAVMKVQTLQGGILDDNHHQNGDQVIIDQNCNQQKMDDKLQEGQAQEIIIVKDKVEGIQNSNDDDTFEEEFEFDKSIQQQEDSRLRLSDLGFNRTDNDVD